MALRTDASFQFPTYIWTLLNNWYSDSTSAVLWNSNTSRSFPVRQGVRQGAVLSPLLYSIFVNDLLVHLESSGLGIHIGNIYCGAPMYADDLTLICNSASDLQAMLLIVSEYATTWRYSFNASKSSILVFGESPSSRSRNRPLRSWRLGVDIIPESDTQLHLGVLRSVSSSNVTRTSARCSAGRSAFYTLNVVGSRFGCLHPVTSLRLYTTFCIPILLYGCELWPLTKNRNYHARESPQKDSENNHRPSSTLQQQSPSTFHGCA